MLSSIFASEAQSLVCKAKVTLNIELGDEVLPMDVEVSSEGVLELYEELIGNIPTAPRRFLVVKADSDAGKELGLVEDTLKLVIDEGDPEYQKDIQEYNLEVMWRIVTHAVKINNKRFANADFEEKKAYLLRRGLTLGHLTELFKRIKELGEFKAMELNNFMAIQAGLTQDVLKKINKRARKADNGTVTSAYNTAMLMKEYGIDFANLPKWDRDAIAYANILRNHFEAEQLEEAKKKRKQDENIRRVNSSVPQAGRGGTFGGI